MILDDPHLTVRQLASSLETPAHTLPLTKLGLSHVYAQWIPHLLSRQQKNIPVEMY